jgi:hypothetical protein
MPDTVRYIPVVFPHWPGGAKAAGMLLTGYMSNPNTSTAVPATTDVGENAWTTALKGPAHTWQSLATAY